VSAEILLFLPMFDDPNRIRELRRDKDWSQQTLADMIGVSKVTISDLERGKMQLTLEYMRRIAAALGVTPGELLSADDNPLLPSAADERALIERFRDASPEERANISRVTEALTVQRKPVSEQDQAA
jgi:transcriptional regulator with XRE-family HTH domain